MMKGKLAQQLLAECTSYQIGNFGCSAIGQFNILRRRIPDFVSKEIELSSPRLIANPVLS